MAGWPPAEWPRERGFFVLIINGSKNFEITIFTTTHTHTVVTTGSNQKELINFAWHMVKTSSPTCVFARGGKVGAGEDSLVRLPGKLPRLGPCSLLRPTTRLPRLGPWRGTVTSCWCDLLRGRSLLSTVAVENS